MSGRWWKILTPGVMVNHQSQITATLVPKATRWVFGSPADQWRGMYAVGMALMTAEVTARPAFRELIDTLNWKDIR